MGSTLTLKFSFGLVKCVVPHASNISFPRLPSLTSPLWPLLWNLKNPSRRKLSWGYLALSVFSSSALMRDTKCVVSTSWSRRLESLLTKTIVSWQSHTQLQSFHSSKFSQDAHRDQRQRCNRSSIFTIDQLCYKISMSDMLSKQTRKASDISQEKWKVCKDTKSTSFRQMLVSKPKVVCHHLLLLMTPGKGTLMTDYQQYLLARRDDDGTPLHCIVAQCCGQIVGVAIIRAEMVSQ